MPLPQPGRVVEDGELGQRDTKLLERREGPDPEELLLERADRTFGHAVALGLAEANEAFLEKHGFRSQVHHRKPKGRPMAPHIRRGNAGRSKIRAAVEHVFARQKGGMGLFVRTIGIARANADPFERA